MRGMKKVSIFILSSNEELFFLLKASKPLKERHKVNLLKSEEQTSEYIHRR